MKMSDKKIQITVIVSADEAEAIEKLSEADKASLTETLTASIRQELIERGFIKTAVQVRESKGKNWKRLDEVQGNITPGMEK
jgi:hypothetical protein